jgi:hypothetical protein
VSRVDHSKCKKCTKVLHISKLKKNPDGVGMVCIDEELCKNPKSNHNISNQRENP